jgi:hypothetical protein
LSGRDYTIIVVVASNWHPQWRVVRGCAGQTFCGIVLERKIKQTSFTATSWPPTGSRRSCLSLRSLGTQISPAYTGDDDYVFRSGDAANRKSERGVGRSQKSVSVSGRYRNRTYDFHCVNLALFGFAMTYKTAGTAKVLISSAVGWIVGSSKFHCAGPSRFRSHWGLCLRQWILTESSSGCVRSASVSAPQPFGQPDSQSLPSQGWQ